MSKPANYGPRHDIEDLYGQDLQVDIEMGDEVAVGLTITNYVECPPPSPLRTRRETHGSKLTPNQALHLAEQLKAAAEEAGRYAD
jgi:hypothetical protein